MTCFNSVFNFFFFLIKKKKKNDLQWLWCLLYLSDKNMACLVSVSNGQERPAWTFSLADKMRLLQHGFLSDQFPSCWDKQSASDQVIMYVLQFCLKIFLPLLCPQRIFCFVKFLLLSTGKRHLRPSRTIQFDPFLTLVNFVPGQRNLRSSLLALNFKRAHISSTWKKFLSFLSSFPFPTIFARPEGLTDL